MTLLTVVQDVCAVVGVKVPAAVFSGITTDRTMQEMVALANEMAQRIAYDTRDWTKLRKPQTFTGNGVKTAHDMPADYKRMLLTGNVGGPYSTHVPMMFMSDLDQWQQRRNQTYTDSHGEWTMLGGQMQIYPALANGATATFYYLHKNCIVLGGGGTNDVFLSDSDTFALDERLLKLGMIGQWKAWKGSPYAEDMSTFADALTVAMGHDGPAPIIIGRRPISQLNVKMYYPGQVP